ncbi:hypothetical protein HN789_03035 [archaeon]|jgi:hypothetical protein|nr:hypothetical protein [archaeon]MBT4023221.1 hypothetical protein [archaeon]MBT4271891.1 hypothetical protein [archaeon]MBT4460990.1 hypothetical protein [archaeon]MBT4858434.1 hypothetical protein [archaeon]
MNIEFLFFTFVEKFLQLLYAPLNHPEMFWILLPLVITVILMELYFGRYPREDPGYHTALENSVFLLFVAVDLVRFLISNESTVDAIKIYLVGVIIAYAICLSLLDFFHKLPRNLAFKTSSKFLISYTAYIGIVLVYSDILSDLSHLSIIALVFSIIILFFMFKFIIGFIKAMEPQAHDDVEEFLEKVEKEIEEAAKVSTKED